MSPIGPKRIGSPMLLGGPHAETLLPTLQATRLPRRHGILDRDRARVGGEDVSQRDDQGHGGAARRGAAGCAPLRVEQVVLESLADLFPGLDWRTLARYMIGRSLQHGRRRAEEMREVALTVDEAGVGSRDEPGGRRSPGLGGAAFRGAWNTRRSSRCSMRSSRGSKPERPAHDHRLPRPLHDGAGRPHRSGANAAGGVCQSGRARPDPAISDDEIRETIETNQLRAACASAAPT